MQTSHRFHILAYNHIMMLILVNYQEFMRFVSAKIIFWNSASMSNSQYLSYVSMEFSSLTVISFNSECGCVSELNPAK